MDVPPREALLDIEWLEETFAAQGFTTLLQCVRRGAEVYGGPVTAIAEALSAWPLKMPVRWRDTIDLRNALAHNLLSSSWTTEPNGPRAHRQAENPNCGLWWGPPEKRAQRLAESSHPLCEPPLPDLSGLRLIEPLDRVWVGHTDGIWGCEVSRDGKYMVSASRDGDVAVWDMEGGTLIARATTGEPEVRDCAFSPDGQRVISVHASGRITIWDPQTMAAVLTLDADVPFLPRPGGLEGPEDALVRIWRRARRFALADDGCRLAVVGRDAVQLWDLSLLEPVGVLPVEGDGPTGLLAVFFAADDIVSIVTRHDYDIAHLTAWDVVSHQMINRRILNIPGAARITRMMATGDARYLVGVSGQETVVVQLHGSAGSTSVPCGSAGQALALSADGRMVATCDHAFPPVVRLHSLPDLREISQYNLWALGCRDIACALAFAPDGRRLILAGWEGVLRRVVLPSL